jgi:isopentenyl-diphosphate delta-isomerase
MAIPSREVCLVDPDGTPLGVREKEPAHREPVPLHRGVSLYVFRGQDLLVTQRSFHKKTWPGVWTNTCCGHPGPGESATAAALRHLDNELGTSTVDQTHVVLPDFRYAVSMGNGWAENELCPVVAATVGGDWQVVPEPSEIADHRWLPWATFVQLALLGLTSPWSQLQVRELLAAGFDPAALASPVPPDPQAVK